MASNNKKDGTEAAPKFCSYDTDVILPTFFLEGMTVEERIKNVKDLKYRHGDIILCTFPKSGTHWVGNLICQLLKKPDEHVNFCSVLLEGLSANELEQWPSPRLLTCHLRPGRLPQEHTTNGGKIVLCLRNPKDVAVSYFHHLNRTAVMDFQQTWEEFLPIYLSGQYPYKRYIDYVYDWEKFFTKNKEDVLVVFYEELQKNGVANLHRIAKHIGVQKSDEELRQVIAECSFDNLKDQANRSKSVPENIRSRNEDKDGKSVIFRKGKIGDWKNYFTVAQSESYDQETHDKLANSIFQFTYEL